MADYSTVNTSRYKVHYFSNGITHTMQFRTGNSDPVIAGVVGFFENALAPLGPALPNDFAILKAEQAALGSTVFTPSTPPNISSWTLGGAPNKARGANFLTFGGKGIVTGALYDFQVFGWNISADDIEGDNYRYEIGESAAIDGVIDELATGATGVLTTIAGDTISWYSYVNFGVSAYWQRRIRRR